MTSTRKAYFVGGGIGSLAAAAFLIRDGGMPGGQIRVLEAGGVMGGSLDGAGDADRGDAMRGGRMLTTDNCECAWDLFKSIPSLAKPGRIVFDETLDFNEMHVSHAMARLVDSRRAKVPVTSMGFSMHDRVELLKLANADESTLGTSCITDHLSPAFFQTEFWFMWVTTFAFQPWHSAVEFRRYLHRFMLEFSRIETLAGVKRTVLNQYDSLVVPLQRWLEAQGVRLINDCTVTDLDHKTTGDPFEVIALHCTLKGQPETMRLDDGDLVFVQNGSMTDASSMGSMTAAPAKLKKAHNGSWTLWEKLAEGRAGFGNPAAFNSCVAQSDWASFTVALKHPAFFDQMQRFSGNEAGTGGLVTFRDSNWLMSIVLAHQPHFANQPADVQVFWGYGLFPDRIGNFVAKAMADCTGAELLQELCGHLPALRPGDRGHGQLHPLPHALHHQHVHAARAGRPPVAGASRHEELRLHQPVCRDPAGHGFHGGVFSACGADGGIPVAWHHEADSTGDTARPHDRSLHAQFDALVKALK